MTESNRSMTTLLREIYLAALEACEPGAILRAALERGDVGIPADAGCIVAVGKCAAPLAREASRLTGITTGLVIHPEGYGEEVDLPRGLERVVGGHPVPTEASMRAARRATALVRRQDRPVLFLVSGGASACVEDGFAPHFTFEQVARIGETLVRSGLPIERINTVRRHLSSIKGGRLGALAPQGSLTLVYSDVPPGQPELVGSGPTAHDPTTLAEAAAILRELADDLAMRLAEVLESGTVPETSKTSPTTVACIADSQVLARAAEIACRDHGLVVRHGPVLDGDVVDVAGALAHAAAAVSSGEVLLATGEPTVVVRGNGKGGRCTELAARFVLEADDNGDERLCGLFGTSDGRDGASPAAAVLVAPASRRRLDPTRAAEALARSASYELVADYGEPIIMMPTGNNLRDIALVGRGR